MDVFELRDRLVGDYATYTKSFIKIADPRIDEFVDTELKNGAFWPEPLLQLNPTFKSGGTVDELVAEGSLHPENSRIFRMDKTDEDPNGKQLLLHTHQREAILKSKEQKSYVLTSGTGSGKSLTYIIPIVDHVLRNGTGRGIQAIIVYPMNALANSQDEELTKFLKRGYPEDGSPVRFARYTGQERGPIREEIRSNPPDILLTNYMMLELLLTRTEDRELVRAAQGLSFLVFDELHTYRGRQGADVALLIRRCREAFGGHEMTCIGTSATMASGGSTEDQKKAVARVAQTLFGTPFDKTQVINETLQRATPELDVSDPAVVSVLKRVIEIAEEPPETFDEFRNHPLNSWIETTFGIRTEPGGESLIRQIPRPLRGKDSASDELAKLTGTNSDKCAAILKNYLLTGSNLKSEAARFPIFAFRFHQFLSRGDTVWSTLEPEDERHLELTKKVAKPGDPDKPLFPLVFCRNCGTEYFRVKEVEEGDNLKLQPREDRREEGDDGSGDAYLYVSSRKPWPHADEREVLARVPEYMREIPASGVERIKRGNRNDIPVPIFVDSSGDVVREGEGFSAALIHKNFLFCLNPDCRVAFVKTQRSERSKLATLGVDNRSTATTILALRSLIELQSDTSLKPEARKLLSFTDNRQDASLQAGHFNDFSQVSLLRSALHKATEKAGEAGLGHGQLSGEVFEAMQLHFEDYAADPDVRGPARQSTNDSLRRVIDYHLYRDLQRGWRVTAPNLEDCGLLRFGYLGLTGQDGLLAENELWTDGFNTRGTHSEEIRVDMPVPLREADSEVRKEVIETLLDVFRRSLAIKVDALDPQKQMDLVDQTKPRLLDGTVWYLEESDELIKAVVAYPRTQNRGERKNLFISSYGAFGRYLKRSLVSFVPEGQRFGRVEVDECINALFLALKRYGIVEQVRSGREGDDPGYQLNADALRWFASDGELRSTDRTRLMEAGEIPPEVNKYFLDSYKSFVDLKCRLEAREHTAQVAPEDRQEREDRFRTASLPLLFCSPTMELGVDIAQLNMVNLRNVPPTPANYAQRSGRAGRGGQPALVFTYCAGRSPHDQYYFRDPAQMVSGAVIPPRIDVRNQDLLRAHVYAIWIEVAKPHLGVAMSSVLDLTRDSGNLPLPVISAVATELQNTVHRGVALRKAETLTQSINDELQTATWFHDNWLKETLDQVERYFEQACDRWRSLYRAAVRQRELHHAIIGDHARPDSERAHSRRLRAQAESQIRLLTEAAGIYQGDFYTYRYLAAEGFLPGYNFPRLPLSAFVPARRRRGRDEFISRPRFLAISEFGPRALVYHEGARYRVYKVNLDYGTDDIESTHDLLTASMKRCTSCGYAHLEVGPNLAEVCDRCGAGLEGSSRVDHLVQLQNVSLKLAFRITCDEEERKRFGYKMVNAYRFPEVGGVLDRKDAAVYDGDSLVMSLSYGDSTDLYRINLGWANQKADQPTGFNLDLERGYWARNFADEQDRDDAATDGRIQRVVPYVRDSKNALVMKFETAQSESEMASLQAVFKETIQKHFQLEPRELAVEPMPTPKDRREILFYESSEGGAGVLRQIAEDPLVMPALAREALKICHFDPDTLEDLAEHRCGKGCYECLLDYGNQPDHKDLDRYLIKDILAELANAECRPAGGTGSRSERLNALKQRCDSLLEKRWLDLVDNLMLRPPSHAQYQVEGQWTQPDFFYADFNSAIYVDGPPHDTPEQIRTDESITRRLIEAGYIVIRFHHKDDWETIFRAHPDIFGTPRT